MGGLGEEEILWAGGPLRTGKVVLLPASAPKAQDQSRARAILSGLGTLQLRGRDGKDHIYMEAQPPQHTASILWIGGNGRPGDIVILAKGATSRDANQAVIHLNGTTGDIVLQNQDCAEDFEMADGDGAEPGTVVVIDDSGTLRPSTLPYDKHVVGVVSGAGNTKPAIVLGKKPMQERGRSPVALVGKVFCKADAGYDAIAIGDLLTTSPTRGHAMKASDPRSAFGAVLGKSMASLTEGTGLIPVLVALQ